MSLPSSFTSEDRLAARFIDRMSRREVDGLTSLYALYQAPLFSFIYRIVHDKGATEEIFQDVFVRAYDRAGEFNPETGTPFVWLATIARRKAIDYLRKRDRRPQFVESNGEQARELADKNGNDAEIGISQQLEARLVLERFKDLPPRQRKALELAFLRGHTQQEIADAMEVPLGTVKSDLRRGLQHLRKLYLGEDD